MRLPCEQCGCKHSFSTLKKQGNSFEVNRRIIYGMKTHGKGSTGERECCSIMNTPPPPTENAFLSNLRVNGRHIEVIANGRHIKVIAKETMKKALQCDLSVI